MIKNPSKRHSPHEDLIYPAVAARRLQWDALLWQVPIVSLTAQAFLFTISLGPGTSRTGRIVAALLSIVMSFLSLTLMKAHRKFELSDAQWLQSYEEKHFAQDEVIHGEVMKRKKNSTPSGGGGWDVLIPDMPGYATWVVGLGLILVAGCVTLFLAIFGFELLTGSS